MPAVPALYCYQYKVAKIMDGLGLRLNRSSQSASVNEFVVFVRKITCLEACAVKKDSVEKFDKLSQRRCFNSVQTKPRALMQIFVPNFMARL